MQDTCDAIIIGAGPAGMMAAITAAKRGRKVILLEKMPAPGRKLLISGKGRCNLTNTGGIDRFLEKFSPSGVFLRNAFARFFNDDIRAFFEDSGCPLKTERGGRVFPASDRSTDVLKALKRRLEAAGAEIRCGEEADRVSFGRGVRVLTKSGKAYFAQKVVIATGGLSYPKTGSSGFGLEIAERLGHTVIKPRPALVPVIVKSSAPGRLQGMALENVECSVICGGKAVERRFGEMLFTHFGLSGPIILDLSGAIYDLLKGPGRVFVSVNLKPGLDHKKLDKRLMREFSAASNKTLKNIFSALLPRRLVGEFLSYCGLSGQVRANQATKAQRQNLINGLFDFRFEIVGTKSVKDAIITRGGVSTEEINPKTMESKLVKGLYFAGEVIDVDAKTGGYNMQAAFSTGYVCGENL